MKSVRLAGSDPATAIEGSLRTSEASSQLARPCLRLGLAIRRFLGSASGLLRNAPARTVLTVEELACQHPRRSLTLAIIPLLLLIGCHKKPPVVVPPEIRTVEVLVPTPTKVAPPAELLAAVKPPLPVFVSPTDPMATSGLTAEGERMLRGLIEELLGRLEAWKKWAETP